MLFGKTGPPERVTFPGPNIIWYHPSALWADPAEVIAKSGGSYSAGEAIAAIIKAMEAVGAWASRPVGVPVPSVVRSAVATLAARALTSSGLGGGGADAPVISERIGDYTVRYAEPDSGGAGVVISGDVAKALAYLRPQVYSTDTGPKPIWDDGRIPSSTRHEYWEETVLPSELQAYVDQLVAAAVAGIQPPAIVPGPPGPQGPPGTPGNPGMKGDDIIVGDMQDGVLADPNMNFGANAPSPNIQAQLAAAPIGSIFVDKDDTTGELVIYQKT